MSRHATKRRNKLLFQLWYIGISLFSYRTYGLHKFNVKSNFKNARSYHNGWWDTTRCGVLKPHSRSRRGNIQRNFKYIKWEKNAGNKIFLEIHIKGFEDRQIERWTVSVDIYDLYVFHGDDYGDHGSVYLIVESLDCDHYHSDDNDDEHGDVDHHDHWYVHYGDVYDDDDDDNDDGDDDDDHWDVHLCDVDHHDNWYVHNGDVYDDDDDDEDDNDFDYGDVYHGDYDHHWLGSVISTCHIGNLGRGAG